MLIPQLPSPLLLCARSPVPQRSPRPCPQQYMGRRCAPRHGAMAGPAGMQVPYANQRMGGASSDHAHSRINTALRKSARKAGGGGGV